MSSTGDKFLGRFCTSSLARPSLVRFPIDCGFDSGGNLFLLRRINCKSMLLLLLLCLSVPSDQILVHWAGHDIPVCTVCL